MSTEPFDGGGGSTGGGDGGETINRTGSDGDGGGGGGLNRVVLPGWIFNLKTLAEVGPATFVRKRIVEFLVATVVTFFSGLGNMIFQAFLWVRDALTGGGAEVVEGFGYVGGFAIGGARAVGGLARFITEISGPLAPVIWIIIIALIGVVLWRLGRALMDSIPVLSGVETFLFG